jgi:hypothetical protein
MRRLLAEKYALTDLPEHPTPPAIEGAPGVEAAPAALAPAGCVCCGEGVGCEGGKRGSGRSVRPQQQQNQAAACHVCTAGVAAPCPAALTRLALRSPNARQAARAAGAADCRAAGAGRPDRLPAACGPPAGAAGPARRGARACALPHAGRRARPACGPAPAARRVRGQRRRRRARRRAARRRMLAAVVGCRGAARGRRPGARRARARGSRQLAAYGGR